MAKYKEHLAIGQYEFVEIEASCLEELISRRNEYLASREAPKDQADEFNRAVATSSSKDTASSVEYPSVEEKKTKGKSASGASTSHK